MVQLKVWLLGISPMVWRRLVVSSTCTLHELHGTALDLDRPGVRRLHPVEDLHQGRLAGAVLPDDGVDGPTPYVEVHVVVRDDTGEPLADAAEPHGRAVHAGVGRSGQDVGTLMSPSMICFL